MLADEIIINIVRMATTKWRPHSRLIEFAPLRWASLRGPISYLCFVSSLFICVYIFSLPPSISLSRARTPSLAIIASTCFIFHPGVLIEATQISMFYLTKWRVYFYQKKNGLMMSIILFSRPRYSLLNTI